MGCTWLIVYIPITIIKECLQPFLWVLHTRCIMVRLTTDIFKWRFMFTDDLLYLVTKWFSIGKHIHTQDFPLLQYRTTIISQLTYITSGVKSTIIDEYFGSRLWIQFTISPSTPFPTISINHKYSYTVLDWWVSFTFHFNISRDVHVKMSWILLQVQGSSSRFHYMMSYTSTHDL